MKRLMVCAILALAFWPAAASAQGKEVTLIGLVVDSTSGQPLDKVAVYLPSDAETDTNRDGMYKLKLVPGQTTLVLFRKIGYAPRAIRMYLQGREGREIDMGKIIMKKAAVALDPIAVETRMLSRNPRMVDFYRRKRQGQGLYFTREDILKIQPMLTTDLVRRVPGLTVGCESMGQCTPASFRKTAAGEVTCPMRVLLDGMPTSMGIDLIPPAWIAGVEVYRSVAFTPLELASAANAGPGTPGCGILVVWTGGDEYESQ